MRQLLDHLVQRPVRQVALDVDNALLVHSTNCNRAHALFYVGKVTKKDASSTCLHGNSAHVFNIITAAAGKAYSYVGVVAMVLHIVRQHAGTTSADSLQACGRSKNLLNLGGISHKLIHIAALKLHLYRRAHKVTAARNTGNG